MRSIVRRWFLASLLVSSACDVPPEEGSLEQHSGAQQSRGGGPGEGGRCAVRRDGTSGTLGEGTIDSNGFCCVPNGDRQTCYACGSGFTCESLPDEESTQPPKWWPTIIVRTPVTAAIAP
jgi:hypothetical protein